MPAKTTTTNQNETAKTIRTGRKTRLDVRKRPGRKKKLDVMTSFRDINLFETMNF